MGTEGTAERIRVVGQAARSNEGGGRQGKLDKITGRNGKKEKRLEGPVEVGVCAHDGVDLGLDASDGEEC